jgi:hypothetical protein
MIRHGMHARCKNFFFQNMVRTDPRLSYAPFCSAEELAGALLRRSLVVALVRH